MKQSTQLVQLLHLFFYPVVTITEDRIKVRRPESLEDSVPKIKGNLERQNGSILDGILYHKQSC